MAADREVLLADTEADEGSPAAAPPIDPLPTELPTELPAEVSAATWVGSAVVGSLLVGWFFFGLLVQRQGWIDSAGESLGAAFALLLAVSVIGTVRRSR